MPSDHPALAALERQLQNCLISDQQTLRPRLHGLTRRIAAGQPCDRALAKLADAVMEAAGRAEHRLQAHARLGNFAALHYPADLPVVAERERIAEAIREHQVVVVAGETGSGKTTQLPKICLEIGRGRSGMIGHTQPRRLAARTVAARIAAELNTELGSAVGYQVRFAEVVAEHTLVKLMTDGILLAEIQRDPLLLRYDTLIIDEAHERSLNIDFLLGYLRQLLHKRPELKLLITSATIDVERFSTHFDAAPVIEVTGRAFPVEICYRPPDEIAPAGDLNAACIAVLEEIVQRDRGRGGDVLIFMPGEREIRELARELRQSDLAGLEILPLYARLSLAEQNRVFDTRQRRGRRVVLATNVAETSLTVPGIHYVIDTGLARISRYSVRSKLQRLPVEPVSQASANQRAGRCGRVAPGTCYRLYEEQEYQLRPAFTDPEIRRTNLAAVILQMLNLGLGKVDAFPFLDPPDARQIGDGFKLLEELGAVDPQRRLTGLGRLLGRLPVDPRVARMLVEAQARGALTEVLIIASALSSQDPRERPVDKQQAASAQHARFVHPESDFMGLVALWQYIEQQRQELSASQFRKLCDREFLSWLRLREWRDTHRQLRLLSQELRREHRATSSADMPGSAGGWKENQQPAEYRAVHTALLAGLLSHIAQRDERREYIAARNRRVKLFPGSALHAKPPAWLVAAEIVETSQIYARSCARIEPDWVFGLNDALLKRSWGEPYWHARSGRVMARETVTLYGLVIRDGARVHYGPIDPRKAREVFIHAALVEGRLAGNAPFQRHNQALIAEIEALEDKGRRRDILADQQTLFDFFAERVPSDIHTARQFETWRREAEIAHPGLLNVPRAALMRHGAETISEAQFPDSWQWQDLEFPLEYRFEPGHPEDGVTLVVPIALLNRVPQHRLDYLVPGLLRDKCISLVKTLPKSWRRQFVPVPDAVDAALTRLQISDRPLTEALGEALAAVRNVSVPTEAWQPLLLEPFYHMHLRIIGPDGETRGQGRDAAELVTELQGAMQEALRQQAARHQTGQQIDEPGAGEPAAREGGRSRPDSGRLIQRWDFGDLPVEIEINQGGARALAYPALMASGQDVSMTLLESPQRAQRETVAGIVVLLMRETADTVKYLRKELLRGNAVHLQLAGIGQHRDDWLEQLLSITYRQVFLPAPDGEDSMQLPRNQAQFEQLLTAGRGRIVGEAQRLAAVLTSIGQAWAELRKRRSRASDLAWLDALNEIQAQLDALLEPGFIQRTPLPWLERYPTYLAAMGQRLDKLRGHYQRDRQLSRELNRLQRRLDELLHKHPALATQPHTQRYRWLLEELRVSMFAQQLGTVTPVSVKRLDQYWLQEVEEERRNRS